MELTPPDERRARLLEAGVPERFLAALDDEEGSVLDGMLLETSKTYADLYDPPHAVDWSGLEGEAVTPVYGDSGDTFLLLASGSGGSRFVELSLGGGLVRAHGADFQAALAALLVDVWELEGLVSDELVALGEHLGFAAASALAEALARADPEGFERDTFLEETVPRLLQS